MKNGIQTKMKKAAAKRLAFELASLEEWNREGGGYEAPISEDIEADIYGALNEAEWDEAADSNQAPEYKKYSDSLVAAILRKLQDVRK